MAAANLSNPPQLDPLAELRDIHLPADIEFWPLSAGWWWLAILIMATISYAIYRGYRYWRSNAYRREGLRKLHELWLIHAQNPKIHLYLQEFNQLLKRIALAAYPRDKVASLTGDAWVVFLDTSSDSQEFTMGAGEVLGAGNYMPDLMVSDLQALHVLGEQWIKNHKPSRSLDA